ncbi:hypothetical protein BDC45DRAFT_502699 [Circinella umbellata]|nr:hypothetical protein BDC45DRAFT_502699 [Circinella umbellata]
MAVSDLFIFDSSIGFIRRRNSSDGLNRPFLTQRFFNDLAQERIYFLAGFARLCLSSNFPNSGHYGSPGVLDARPISQRLAQNLLEWKTKTYRNICHAPCHCIPTISSKQWSMFWAWPMEHSTKNIWYRALHNTIPTASRSHHFQLSTAPTPICNLCNSGVDTMDHFIIGCPHKYKIWQLVWGRIRYADPAPSAILALIRHLTIDYLDFFINLSHQYTHVPTIVACIFQAVLGCLPSVHLL